MMLVKGQIAADAREWGEIYCVSFYIVISILSFGIGGEERGRKMKRFGKFWGRGLALLTSPLSRT
jgi:hypothetical protein